MSRILHLVNMGLRYEKSKGVREYRQEEPPLGSLTTSGHLEESASHHIKGGPGNQTGGTPSDQSGCRLSHGGECFVAFSIYVRRPYCRRVLIFPF